jgi:hypothetical protein
LLDPAIRPFALRFHVCRPGHARDGGCAGDGAASSNLEVANGDTQVQDIGFRTQEERREPAQELVDEPEVHECAEGRRLGEAEDRGPEEQHVEAQLGGEVGDDAPQERLRA